jgi:hypothetical protein
MCVLVTGLPGTRQQHLTDVMATSCLELPCLVSCMVKKMIPAGLLQMGPGQRCPLRCVSPERLR